MPIGRDAILDFLAKTPRADTKRQTVFTACILAAEDISEDVRLAVVQDLDRLESVTQTLLDESLVSAVISRLSTEEKARLLWSLFGMCMSPPLFCNVFFELYSTSDDLVVLHQIGGAANDYLRRRRGALKLPEELCRCLLKSQNVDHRVVGLKLLKHSIIPTHEVLTVLAESLNNKSPTEGEAALCEVHYVLELTDGNIDADPDDLELLMRALDSFAARVSDEDIKHSAALVRAALGPK